MTLSPITPIRVMLVDDHPMVRQGLATMLTVFDDMRLVGKRPDRHRLAAQE